METLYCFKLNLETYQLEKIEIKDYSVVKSQYSNRKTYSWSNPKINKWETRYFLESTKLDRFVCNRVFTFRNDEPYVWNIITQTINKELDTCMAKAMKLQSLIEGISYNKRRE